MKRFLWYQAPFLAACIAIFAASSVQGLPQIPLPVLQDKIPHAFVFCVLTILAYRAFLHQEVIRPLARSPLFSAFLFSMIYGAIDEFHQYFVPGRHTDFWDIVADAVGAFIGLSIVYLSRRREATRRSLEEPA